jgi:hypothetical protein
MTVRIDQLTEPPRVGRSYLVPCLVPRNRDTQNLEESLSDFHGKVYRDWVMGVRPVLLPLHEDSELGTAQEHYHIDIRFCSELRLRDFRDSSKSFTSHEIKLHEMVNSHEEFLEDFFRLEWLNLKCYRHLPEFTPTIQTRAGYQFLKSFVGKSVDCGKCPHRGLHIASVQRSGNAGDRVVCPGHGLIIDLKTNRVIGLMSQEVKSTLAYFLVQMRIFDFAIAVHPIQIEFTVWLLEREDQINQLQTDLQAEVDQQLDSMWLRCDRS